VSANLGRGVNVYDIGLGVYGRWSLAAPLTLEYGVTGVNGAGPNKTTDDTERKNVFGRVGLVWQRGSSTLWLGASAADGDQLDPGPTAAPTDDSVFAFRRLGADLRVDSPWAFLAAEAIGGIKVQAEGQADQRGVYATLVGKTPWNVGTLFRFEVLDPDLAVPADLGRVLTIGAYLEVDEVKARLLVNAELDFSDQRRDDTLLAMTQVVF
jgi:hypothetical protein